MFNLRNLGNALLFLPLILIVGIGSFFIYGFIYGGYNFVEINMYSTFEKRFNDCQQDYNTLTGDFMELKERRQVVCEVPENKFNMAFAFLSFISGGCAAGYLILVGYPWVKNRLDDRIKKVKK